MLAGKLAGNTKVNWFNDICQSYVVAFWKSKLLKKKKLCTDLQLALCFQPPPILPVLASCCKFSFTACMPGVGAAWLVGCIMRYSGWGDWQGSLWHHQGSNYRVDCLSIDFLKFGQMKWRARHCSFVSNGDHWQARGKHYCLTNSAQYGTFDSTISCINLIIFLAADLIAYTFKVLPQPKLSYFSIYKVRMAVNTFCYWTWNHKVRGGPSCRTPSDLSTAAQVSFWFIVQWYNLLWEHLSSWKRYKLGLLSSEARDGKCDKKAISRLTAGTQKYLKLSLVQKKKYMWKGSAA